MDYTTQDIINLIEVQAIVAQVNPQDALRVSFCESSHDAQARNPHSSAGGLWQFTDGTFLDGIRWMGVDWKLEDKYDPYKSTLMAMWFINKEGYNRWVCKN